MAEDENAKAEDVYIRLRVKEGMMGFNEGQRVKSLTEFDFNIGRFKKVPKWAEEVGKAEAAEAEVSEAEEVEETEEEGGEDESLA